MHIKGDLMQKIRLGVLGVSGHFVGRVIPALKKSNIVELYAIASRSKERSLDASRRYGITKAYGSYEELIEDREVKIVYIPLPNNMHLEWIKRCADKGKHIICEKPITLNAAEALDAAEYAAKKNVKLMEAFMYKFHPKWIEALKMIREGNIGTLQTIHTFFSFTNKDPGNIRNIKEAGGGANLDIGCYAVSSARLIFGREPLRVLGTNDIDKEFTTDMMTSGILDFGIGRCQFTVSTQSFPFQRVEIHGTDGVIILEMPFNQDPHKRSGIIYISKTKTRIIPIKTADQYKIQFEDFAVSVRDDKKVPFKIDDAINNMKVLDALTRSVNSGKWESL
jgi:predicted dehydrogenase